MLLKILKRLLILSVVLEFSSCEEADSKVADATSRIRFVQYQPAVTKKDEQSDKNAENSDPSNPDEQETKSSQVFADVTRGVDRRQDQLSHINDDKTPSLVPKNYAFAYAIRDPNSGDDFSHTQAHNGQATKGQYHVKLPDGRVQFVRYLADNGGYRADIHYDKDDTIYEGQADDSLAYLQRSSERPVLQTARLLAKQKDPLLYFNEMRSFGVTTTGKPATSYETHENINEGKLVYDKKLVDDVNYLLKYIAPTIETRTENVFDITPDNLLKKQQLVNARANNNNIERVGRLKFEMPVDYTLRPVLDTRNPAESNNAGRVKLPQFGTPRPLAAFYSPQVNPTPKQQDTPSLYRRPQVLLPLRIQPQYVTAKYEPQDNSKYNQQGPPQFNDPNSSALRIPTETPRYESQEQSPVNNLKYDPQNLSQYINQQPRYESNESPSTRPTPTRYESQEQGKSQESLQLRTPKYGGLFRESALQNLKTDTRLFPSRKETPLAPQYTSKAQLKDQIQPPKYDPRNTLYVTTPQYQKEQDASVQVSVGKYDNSQGSPELVHEYNIREQSHFVTPKVEPQKFRPSQPFVPRSEEKPLFYPQVASYRPQYTSRLTNPTTTSKYQQYEELNYSGLADGASVEAPKAKYTSQESLPISPVSNFNSQEQPPIAPITRYQSKEAPSNPGSAPYTSDEYQSTTPTIPLFLGNIDDQKPNSHFGKIEIPQYLHIHRYESGEDAKPKELIYYTPLHIPIPNSMAYMERGNLSDTSKDDPYGLYTPAYLTMTEHPHLAGEQNSQFPEGNGMLLYDQARFELPTNFTSPSYVPTDQSAPLPPANQEPEIEIPDFNKQLNDLRFTSRPVYNFDARPLRPPAQQYPHVPTEGSGEEHRSQENIREDSPYFDARAYSGYFDFLPSTEMQEEKPVPENVRESEQTQEKNPPSGRTQFSPYLRNYATATPSHRYINSESSGREGNAPLLESDPARNNSFRTSAYLRPLHKERVYIHHNSQPTPATPSDDHFSGIASTTRMQKKTADISIVKSISSTIPPELLKDFDYQLAASIIRDTLHEGSEQTSNSVLPTATAHPKLSKNIVKKLQTALSTNGKIYFKTPTQQERTVS